MRIFITGGTGFLGQAVCEALEGHELCVLTRSPSPPTVLAKHQALVGDLRESGDWKSKLLDFRPDACLHFAWEGLPDYSAEMCERNFQATMELYRLLAEANCPRIVVAGTCWEYGKASGRVSEEREGENLGPFPQCKTRLRVAGETLFAPRGQAFLWARPFFVYGPGQRPSSLLPATYSDLIAGRDPAIQTPDAVNDFIHVTDVAAAFARLATSSVTAGVYNIGTGQPHRVRDAVNLLAELMGQSAVFPPSDETGPGMWADISRIQAATGWQPQLSLAEGIRRTLDAWTARR